MSYTKAFFSTLFLFVAIITHVHAEEPVAEQKSVVLANVNVYKSAIVSNEGGQLTVGFDIANSGTVAQGDIRYGIDVVKATPQGQTIVDSFVADETLALAPQSTVHKSLAYAIPASLQGEYEIWVIARTSSGMMLGLGRAGTTTFTNTAPYIALAPETCAITVSGETDHYTLYQGVDVSPLETLSLVCTLESHFETDTTVTPSFSTHRRSTYGALVDTAPVTPEPITLKAGEKKVMSFIIPKAIAPQAYDVSLVLQNEEKKDVSNKIVAHYVLRGPSATIQTATLDKVSYAQGDTLKALIRWTPSADSFHGAREKATTLTTTTLALSVTDKNGTACIAPMTQLLTTQELTLTASVTTPCIEPILSLTLSDGNGATLDSRTIASPATPSLPVIASEPMTEKTSIWTLKFLIILITTVSAFILLYVLIKVRATLRGEVILKSLILTFVFTASCLSGVGEARADAVTYTEVTNSNVWNIVTNLNQSTYAPNEPMIFSTSITSLTCSNALDFTHLSATLQGVQFDLVNSGMTGMTTLYYSSQYPAPSVPGNYRIYFDFTAGNIGTIGYIYTGYIDITVVSPCVSNNGATCSSSANSCGQTNSGTIQCDGSCSAGIPANPSGLGTSCQSSANVCGLVNTGTIQCNGSCSATTPSNASCPSTAVNGSCDSSNGTTVSVQPTANICLAGIPAWTDTTATDGTYNWDCAGANGGTDASCSATKSSIPAPTLTLSASPTTITTGNSSNLTWTIGGAADSCWASGGWTGWKTFSGSDTETVSPLVTTSYSLECWNQGVSSGLKSTTVTVTPPPVCPPGITKNWTVGTNSCTGITTTANYNTSSAINDNTLQYIGTASYLCTNNGTWASNPNAGATCAMVPDLSASPKIVESGNTTVITWDVHGQTGCTLTGGGFSFNPYNGTSATTLPILGRTNFILKCPLGEKVQTVDVIPKYSET